MSQETGIVKSVFINLNFHGFFYYPSTLIHNIFFIPVCLLNSCNFSPDKMQSNACRFLPGKMKLKLPVNQFYCVLSYLRFFRIKIFYFIKHRQLDTDMFYLSFNRELNMVSQRKYHTGGRMLEPFSCIIVYFCRQLQNIFRDHFHHVDIIFRNIIKSSLYFLQRHLTGRFHKPNSFSKSNHFPALAVPTQRYVVVDIFNNSHFNPLFTTKKLRSIIPDTSMSVG